MSTHDRVLEDLALVKQIPLFAIDEAAAAGFGAEFTLDQHLAFQRVIAAVPELLSELSESERNLDLVRGGYEQVLADDAQLEQRITSALAAYEERTFQWETERARAEAELADIKELTAERDAALTALRQIVAVLEDDADWDLASNFARVERIASEALVGAVERTQE